MKYNLKIGMLIMIACISACSNVYQIKDKSSDHLNENNKVHQNHAISPEARKKSNQSPSINKRGKHNQAESGNINRNEHIKQKTREGFQYTVTAFGFSEAEALKNAFRIALEKTYGAYIYSHSVANLNELISDKIHEIVKGSVVDYKIISRNSQNDGIYLKVQVYIQKEFIQKFSNKHQLKTWDGIVKNLDPIEFKQQQLKQHADLLKKLFSTKEELLERGYIFNITGYEITDIGIDNIEGNYLVDLNINEPFWNQYYEIINNIGYQIPIDAFTYLKRYGYMSGIKYTKDIIEGRFVEDRNRNRKNTLNITRTKRVNPVLVHNSLAPYLCPTLWIEYQIHDYPPVKHRVLCTIIHARAKKIESNYYFIFNGKNNHVLKLKFRAKNKAELIKKNPIKGFKYKLISHINRNNR